MTKVMGFLFRHARLPLILSVLLSLLSGMVKAIVVIYLTDQTLAMTWGRRDVLTLLIVFASYLIIRPLTTRLLTLLAIRVKARLRLNLAAMITQLPLETVERLGSSRLQGLLIHDLDVINTMTTIIPVVLMSSVVVLATLGYMLTISWQATAVVSGMLAVGVVINIVADHLSKHSLHQLSAHIDEFHHGVRGVTDGIKELQLNTERRDSFLAHSINAPDSAGARMIVRIGTIGGVTESITTGIWVTTVAAIAWMMYGSGTDSTERTAALGMLLFSLKEPTTEMFTFLREVGRVSVSMHRLDEVGFDLDTLFAGSAAMPPTPSLTTTHSKQDALKTLEAYGLTYAHQTPERDFVVGPISMTFRPGELVFLLGENGSGKTTLAKMLVGLYPAHQGTLRWNGRIVEKNELAQYRHNFSAVFFDFYLISHLYETEDPPKVEMINRAISRFGLAGKVHFKDGAFSTVELSQGQRRRLALITALADERPICVFDESAADQDPEYRKAYYTEFLLELRKQGKTVIVISHDEQYFHVADRTVKLRDGKVIEERSNLTRSIA